MIQIAICDDEPYVVRLVSKNLDKIVRPMAEYKSYKFTNPEDLMNLLKNTEIDLLLIDIEMPDINGFEVAKQVQMLHENILIIFITNMDFYVYESLKYHPFRFIRKTHLEEMQEAVASAVTAINTRNEKFLIHINSSQDVNVKLNDIVYFESVRNDAKAVTIKQDYTFRSTLKNIEHDLKGKGFVRIHSGYILNVKYVYLIKNTEVEVRYSGMKIDLPISRVHRNDLITEYTNIFR